MVILIKLHNSKVRNCIKEDKRVKLLISKCNQLFSLQWHLKVILAKMAVITKNANIFNAVGETNGIWMDNHPVQDVPCVGEKDKLY